MGDVMTVYMDITNLTKCKFLTGIQRVVREVLVRFLREKPFPIVLLAYDMQEGSFRSLDTHLVQNWLETGAWALQETQNQPEFDIGTLSKGDVFFDLDAVWHSTRHRSELYPCLKATGVRIVSYIYDIIPISRPQFYNALTLNNFLYYIAATLRFADKVLVSTESTLKEVHALCDSLQLPRVKCAATWLGADFEKKEGDKKGRPPHPDAVRAVKAGRYVLMLGTIQPLKNHRLVLDAFDQSLFKQGVNLIFAGKMGWNIDDFANRLKDHPLRDKQFFLLEGMDDVTVDYLYEHAFCLAFATFNEGFGLPTIEAFLRGTPVLASDVPVLREVGGDFCKYFDPKSPESFISAISPLLESEDAYKALRDKVATYRPVTWNEVSQKIVAQLREIARYSPAESLLLLLGTPLRRLALRNRRLLPDSPMVNHRIGDEVFLPLHQGFAEVKKGKTWTVGSKAEVRLSLKGGFRDLRLDMRFATFNGRQPVSLYANGVPVAQFEAFGSEECSFFIPGKCVGRDRSFVLELDLPNAISPKEIGIADDMRPLALLFSSMRLSADDASRFAISPGTLLSFAGAEGAPALRFCQRGMSHEETSFTWTKSRTVSMLFSVGEWKSKPSAITLHYGTYLPEERVVVNAGDVEIANYVAHGEETRRFEIPPEATPKHGRLAISLTLPDSVSPRELGKGADGRRLALSLFSVRLD